MENIGIDVHENQSQLCILTDETRGHWPKRVASERTGRLIELWMIDGPVACWSRRPGRYSAPDDQQSHRCEPGPNDLPGDG